MKILIRMPFIKCFRWKFVDWQDKGETSIADGLKLELFLCKEKHSPIDAKHDYNDINGKENQHDDDDLPC